MQAINQVAPGRLGSCSLSLIPCPWSHTSTPWQLQVTGQHTAELAIGCSSRSCNWDGKAATSHYFPSPWLCDAVSLGQRRQRRTEDCDTSSYCSQSYWGLTCVVPPSLPPLFPFPCQLSVADWLQKQPVPMHCFVPLEDYSTAKVAEFARKQ